MAEAPLTPGTAADLIEYAAGIIVAKRNEPHTAPYHWAAALWESGMLQPPGRCTAPVGTHQHSESCRTEERRQNQHGDNDHRVAALRRVLAERERELLDLKGPCTNAPCCLHYAHSGPCDTEEQP